MNDRLVENITAVFNLLKFIAVLLSCASRFQELRNTQRSMGGRDMREWRKKRVQMIQ